MKKITGLIIFVMLTATQLAYGRIDYTYISTESLMDILKKKQPIHMVDVQKKNNYLRHHFAHSIGTDAYPVKTGKDTDKIKAILNTLQASDNRIVIIGPRGTRASQRAYAFLLQQGIAPQRLAILKKGTRGWPAPEIFLNTSGT